MFFFFILNMMKYLAKKIFFKISWDEILTKNWLISFSRGRVLVDREQEYIEYLKRNRVKLQIHVLSLKLKDISLK